MDLNEEQLKEALFEIYSAGFEAGMSQNIDIRTAYNEFWNVLKSNMKGN